MLLNFLFALRSQGLKVGISEWLGLLQGLQRGLHDHSLTGFYQLGRMLLVHSEADYDRYDQAFAEVFAGIEAEALQLDDALAEWLKDPALLRYLSPEERAKLATLDLDELRRLLAERLRKQRERHDGGSHWVGTGGTSPFGHGGYHPTGVRIGGQGGGMSAAQIAGQRFFRAYRHDLVLDLRQIKLALRRLRDLRRDGQRDELDLDATIDRIGRNAGELELVFRPPRRNNVKVILLMDVGGSMTPHSRVMSQLFSAAAQTKHFRDFHAFYFHNCVYDQLYRDAWQRDGLPLADVLHSYGPSYKLLVVGDAMMHPMELFHMGGASDFWTDTYTPGIDRLRQLADHFKRAVWLNPEPPRFWNHQTVGAIRGLFPMFPLTLDGLQAAVAELVGARRHRPRAPGR